MSVVDVLVAVGIVIGLVGVVVPVVPGVVLVAAVLVVWGIATNSAAGWVVVAAAAALLAGGQVAKYVLPNRHLRAAGVASRSLVVGGLLAIVGFFVVPVVGMLFGFVLGVYASEVQRVGLRLAWPSTKAVLRAVGVSMLIELASVVLAAAVWVAGVVVVA